MRFKALLLYLCAIVLFTVAPAACGGGGGDTTAATAPGRTGSITLEEASEAGAMTVPPEGGTVAITAEDERINGLTLNVPPEAYPDAAEFTVSYAPVKEHSFGDDFTPISPMISIDNGNVLADEPIELTIPVTVPEDEFAMAFYYDDDAGTLEGLPLVSSDADSVTVATRHFSSIVVSAIKIALLHADIDSGFRPGVDDWQFVNRGSYLAPGGHCSGQSLSAIWYYEEKPDGPNETLYGRYDNNGWQPATPDLWYDDSLGYRFASVNQEDQDFGNRLFNLAYNTSTVLEEETWYLFAYSILVTGQPQLVAVFEGNKPTGHALIAYRVLNGNLHVADPNYPGATDRVIRFENGAFLPYPSGANADDIAAGNGKSYDRIVYAAKSGLVDWDKIRERWEQFKTLTIGDTLFPAYRVDWGNVAENKWETLKDGLEVSDQQLRLRLVSPLAEKSRYQVYRDGQKLSFVTIGSGSGVTLQEGNNKLGFYITGIINGREKYVDFQYINVVYTPATTTPPTTTTTTTTPAAKTWKLDEVVLPDLPDMPVEFRDQFGSHSMILLVDKDYISSDITTAGPGDTVKGWCYVSVDITGIPDTVTLGEEVQTTATWDFEVEGEPRYTSSMVELRRGDFNGELKRITVDQNPTGSITLEWSPAGDEFEVTMRLVTYVDARIKWVYRLQQ